MRAQPIRFTGMASGMDTDSIVKDLMRPQQYKVDKEKKAQALLQLKQDAWKDMNKTLYNFHTKFIQKLGQEGTFTKKITTVSNPGAMSIDNEALMPEGSHNFTIGQLATSTTVTGNIQASDGVVIDANTTVGQLTGSSEKEIKLGMLVTVDGKEKNISVTVSATDKLTDVAKKMNEGLKDTGFSAGYDAANKKFFVNATKTGANQDIEFDNATDGATLFTQLGLNKKATEAGPDGPGEPGAKTPGQDAKYNYNGAELKSSSNQIEVNGIKATLKATSTESITVISTLDPDATYDFIKEFVNEYNNLLDDIHAKLGAKPGKDIEPLTAEERDSMSESEIKLWEDKLNSSLFYGDPELTAFVDSMRSVLTTQFGGDLAKYGIVTGSWEEKGKLHIMGDEDDELYAGKTNKLREELAKDPGAVAKKFAEIGSTLYKGINDKLVTGNKLKSAMNFYNDKVITDKMSDSEKRIFTLEERMYKMEEMQYRKFAAMEKMLSSLNNQSSWLSQQFGG